MLVNDEYLHIRTTLFDDSLHQNGSYKVARAEQHQNYEIGYHVWHHSMLIGAQFVMMTRTVMMTMNV